MDGKGQLAETTRKNLICNFRAPSEQHFNDWKEFVAWCQEHGRDVCHLTLSLAKTFMLGVNGSASTTIKEPQQTINLQMNNTFTYAVQKPRREPFSLNCIKSEYRRSFSSILYESYVTDKARRINGEISFRDFLEMDDRAFHRIMRRLIRKGVFVANPRRSIPRTYILCEKLPDYNLKKF